MDLGVGILREVIGRDQVSCWSQNWPSILSSNGENWSRILVECGHCTFRPGLLEALRVFGRDTSMRECQSPICGIRLLQQGWVHT